MTVLLRLSISSILVFAPPQSVTVVLSPKELIVTYIYPEILVAQLNYLM